MASPNSDTDSLCNSEISKASSGDAVKESERKKELLKLVFEHNSNDDDDAHNLVENNQGTTHLDDSLISVLESITGNSAASSKAGSSSADFLAVKRPSTSQLILTHEIDAKKQKLAKDEFFYTHSSYDIYGIPTNLSRGAVQATYAIEICLADDFYGSSPEAYTRYQDFVLEKVLPLAKRGTEAQGSSVYILLDKMRRAISDNAISIKIYSDVTHDIAVHDAMFNAESIFRVYAHRNFTDEETPLLSNEKGRCASVKILPHDDMEGGWDVMFYPAKVKFTLLNFAHSLMKFAAKKVDLRRVSGNRIIMLEGPPGTGKSSLCRALANKIAIQGSSRFEAVQFVEIKCHALFSKWFSESGKIVEELFSEIIQRASTTETYIVVFLDEVESLVRSRQETMGGNEPSDAMRAVNAVLVGLDKLMNYGNILVLATSNVTSAIDAAFMSRCDVVLKVDLPDAEAIYKILVGFVNCLLKCGYLSNVKSLYVPQVMEVNQEKNASDKWLDEAKAYMKSQIDEDKSGGVEKKIDFSVTKILWLVAKGLLGKDGRDIKRIPLYLDAYYFVLQDMVDIREYLLKFLDFAIEQNTDDAIEQKTDGGKV